MTLATGEFIRRFLLHLLPKGFHRIRHYGLLASAGRSRDDDAATRHGSYPRYVVAMCLPPSTPRAPIGSPAPFGMHIAAAITQFAHSWPPISATIAQQNFWDAHPEQHDGHHNRLRRHSDNLKSP